MITIDTIVLLSGGLDSYVLADIAKKNSDHVYGLTFNYMQVNEKEIDCAKKIAEDMEFKDHIIINIDMGDWRDKYLNTTLVKNASSSSGSSAYVPARNMIFLSYAVGIAESVHVDNIAIGTALTDFGDVKISNNVGFPDCHPMFLKDMQNAARDISNGRISIYAPLTYMTKIDIIKYGINNNLDFNKTWTCYKNEEKPCGKCIACKTRIYGFYKNNQKDTLLYDNYEQIERELLKEWQV